MITKQNLIDSINNQDILLVKSFTDKTPSWKDIDNLYNSQLNSNDILFKMFGSVVFKNSEKYTNCYDEFIYFFKKLINSKMYSAITVVNFYNNHNNIVYDNDAKELLKKINENNTNKKPNDIILYDYGIEPKNFFRPSIHSDQSHNFFIQGEGSTLWKIYDNAEIIENKEIIKTITAEKGDFIYIPKNLFHSVETLCPRFSVTFAFDDF